MNQALKHALCALSFYRARNLARKRFAKPTKRHHKDAVVSQRARMVYLARKEIALARQCGWHGSVRAALHIDP